MYKVVIPSAGVGSRIGPYTKFMNKALVTINHQPAIAHIIDQFPDAHEIIILLGYKGDYIKQVVKAMYPEREIRFIYVDKYEGVGSGLGYTLSCAKEHLQCPFIFTSNDTVIPNVKPNNDPDNWGNWMGYTRVDGDCSQYRTVTIENYRIVSINPKGAMNSDAVYIGLCGIKDYEEFWKAMESPQAIAVGESYGLKSLSHIAAHEYPQWCDIGNLESLAKTKAILGNGKFNILEKENEAIWFKDGKVFKFCTDESFIDDRMQRLAYIDNNLIPKVVLSKKNLYVYKMVNGDVISKHFTVPRMIDVLNKVDELMWQKHKTPPTDELIQRCYEFYRDKTYKRVEMFHNKFEVLDQDEMINGEYVPKTAAMLDAIDWDVICTLPYSTAFHGDFHNENIIINDHGEPILIDWRQNFGKGNYEIGDAYYDWAKYYHGLIVSHAIVHKNMFDVNYLEKDNIEIEIYRTLTLVEAEEAYINWLNFNCIDVGKVRLLTALIFLNVAALHEYPYSIFLYYLGKHLLMKWGEGYEHCNW